MAAISSKEAAAYLIDPLNAPEPSQETGPGTHFYPPTEPVASASSRSATSPSSSTNPFRKSSVGSKSGAATHVRQASRDVSASPNGSPRPFPNYRETAFSGLNEAPRRTSNEHKKTPSYDQAAAGPSRRRGSSLKERYPGDESNKPLDVIRRDSKKAHRAPHLRKQHIPGPDSIDRLDPTSALAYHHEGPYDAALLARNTSYKSSPVAALADSNREALKATPAENIKEALERHKPLDGVAVVPPGERDRLGRVYNYEEGTDMMRDGDAEGGPYKQWPGVDYAKEDVHGQGEPSFSLDRALQAHTIHEREFDGHRGIELSDRPGKDTKRVDPRDPVEIAGGEGRYMDMQHDMDAEAHANKTGSLRRAGEGLKKRLSTKKRRDS